jgi:DNA-directed RNA polymerase III subunit RPC7
MYSYVNGPSYSHVIRHHKTYDVPQAAPLSKKEDKQVSYFLLFREQAHDGPLYTQTRTTDVNDGEPTRTYGQDQINQRYGVKNKGTVDPFLSMPTYSQRFNKQERALPDLASRPFAKEFFPAELHATLEGEDGGDAKRRKTNKKTLALSNITALKTAEELFLPETQQRELAEAMGQNKAMEMLEKIENNEGGVDETFLEDDDDDWVRPTNNEDGEDGDQEEDDEFDDESGDDYNAEQYFEGNQDEDDYEDGGDGDDYYN